MAEDHARGAATNGRPGNIHSIGRAFTVLEIMASHGGSMGISRLATETGMPQPTIHRLVRTLVDLGYVRQESSREYVLGPKLMFLGESASQMLSVWARPHLAGLVEELGESANLAMLDGDQIVYVAQVPSRHSMRMFTEVGRRVLPHCTAVGKAVMAQMDPQAVQGILQRTGMPAKTENTMTTTDVFMRSLEWSAGHGYALDEGEQEIGVRCVAVAVPGAPVPLAISISGPTARMSDDLVAKAVPLLSAAGAALSEDLR